jgi:hypothetical protein
MSTIFRYGMLIVLVAAGLAVGIGVWANWDLDRDLDGQADGFTLHVFDADWWLITRDETRYMVDETEHYLRETGASIWGDGGLLTQAEQLYQRWLAQNPEAQQQAEAALDTPPESVERNPLSDPATAPTQHLEDNISDAGQHFSVALAAWRAAAPDAETDPQERLAQLELARRHARSVMVLLDGTNQEYAKRADHDPALLLVAQQLQERCGDLLQGSAR